jgi:hypothetical protein
MTESESKGTRRIVVGMYSFKTSDAASQVRDGRGRGGSAARHRPRGHTGTASAFVTLLAEL